MRDPTAEDVEFLVSSWSWRLTKPLYRIEKEIRRWPWLGNPKSAPVVPEIVPEVIPEPVPEPISIACEPELEPADEIRVEDAPVARERDTFVLYRILGNDLPPRHGKGQTRTNLALILAHEPAFENCEKRWIVNRIFDAEEEALILDLLDRSGQIYTRIPFDLEAYRSVGWDTESFAEESFFLRDSFDRLDPTERERAEIQARRFKNNYAMNNNGGRNVALKEGRGDCEMDPSLGRQLLRDREELAIRSRRDPRTARGSLLRRADAPDAEQ